jgi:hypothetical protein
MQDSWNLIEFYQVKRMIRGLGDETSSTYSQTFLKLLIGKIRVAA